MPAFHVPPAWTRSPSPPSPGGWSGRVCRGRALRRSQRPRAPGLSGARLHQHLACCFPVFPERSYDASEKGREPRGHASTTRPSALSVWASLTPGLVPGQALGSGTCGGRGSRKHRGFRRIWTPGRGGWPGWAETPGQEPTDPVSSDCLHRQQSGRPLWLRFFHWTREL